MTPSSPKPKPAPTPAEPPADWADYEAAKRKLAASSFGPAEYERRVRAIAAARGL